MGATSAWGRFLEHPISQFPLWLSNIQLILKIQYGVFRPYKYASVTYVRRNKAAEKYIGSCFLLLMSLMVVRPART